MLVRDYEAVPIALRDFSLEVPEKFNWGTDVIDVWGREIGDEPALVHFRDGREVKKLTFSDVSRASGQLANYFLRHGVTKGDAVMLMLPNTPMLWLSVVALVKTGAVVVPTAPTLTEKDIEYRIATANVKGIITDVGNSVKFDTVASKSRRLLSFLARSEETGATPDAWLDMSLATDESPLHPKSETKSTDPAFVYFTSGTEGPPKMVVHTHAGYPLGHRVTALWLGIERGQLHWNISSPGWAKHAWSSIFAPWNVGAPTFSYGYEGGFNAAKHLQRIADFRVASICAAPTIWRMFSLEDLTRYDLSSLKNACSAGEPLNPEVIERFRKATGVTIRDGYGQTETVLAVGNFPGVEIRQGSMGVPSPIYDVEVVDEDGVVLPAEEEGYVAIRLNPRPFALFKGYANDPAKTDEVFRNGWYYTGDRARKDEDGYFWFVGRADDVIKSSGYRIGPFEVESALTKHPSVAETAVVPTPDQVRGAIVKAFVVLRMGYTPSQELADELAAFVAKETGPYKHPRRIEFVASLDPVKTISGKIRRKNLKLAEYGKTERPVSGAEFVVRPLRVAS
jgi:acetyl-CoA synthetase/medium-chain acyl-CoA synthetase